VEQPVGIYAIKPNRSEAIRRPVELGLSAKKNPPGTTPQHWPWFGVALRAMAIIARIVI
jgi:hypothetical protein